MPIREFKPGTVLQLVPKPKRSAIRRYVSNATPTKRVDLTTKPVPKPVSKIQPKTIAAPKEVTREASVSDVVNAINQLANFISKMEAGNRASLMSVLETQKENNKTIVDSLQSNVDKKVSLRTHFTITNRDSEGRIAEFVAEEDTGVPVSNNNNQYETPVVYPNVQVADPPYRDELVDDDDSDDEVIEDEEDEDA